MLVTGVDTQLPLVVILTIDPANKCGVISSPKIHWSQGKDLICDVEKYKSKPVYVGRTITLVCCVPFSIFLFFKKVVKMVTLSLCCIPGQLLVSSSVFVQCPFLQNDCANS